MVVLGRQRPFKRHRLIFFFNDHHLSSCRRPVNQGEMSVGSRRPTVSKQLRNYADNTPLSPGGKKILPACRHFDCEIETRFQNFRPDFRPKKKKKKFIARSSKFRNFKKSSTRGKRRRRGFLLRSKVGHFSGAKLFVVIRSKHPSASLFRRRPMPSVTHRIAGRKLSTSHSPRFQTHSFLSRLAVLLDAN